MGKEFKKKYMHPTRRKLVDMVQTGEYEKNATIGYDVTKKERKVGDIWEDEYHRYEKKAGYTLKTGKNSESLQKIREYLEEKSKCKNSDCKTHKKSIKDKKMIETTGYCLNCTVDNEHKIRVSGLWKEYEEYRMFTRMIVFGKGKIEALKESLDEVKEEYEMIGSDGKVTETWKLPKPVNEVKADIQKLIDNGESELEEIIEKRKVALTKLKEAELEIYL